MNRRLFIIGVCLCAVGSCARMEKRAPHYNPSNCPLCTTRPGVCSGCNGSGKCTFCGGTGTRATTTAGLASEDITTVTYNEKCPYCNGTGVCRYCEGSGKCWGCKGSGHVENWDFFEQYQRERQEKDNK